jgi:hypothetical protein
VKGPFSEVAIKERKEEKGMKKLMSVAVSGLIAVATATGVFAVESPSASTTATATVNGEAVTVVNSEAALKSVEGPAVAVVPGAADNAAVVATVEGDVVGTFEVYTQDIDGAYTVTLTNAQFTDGAYHYVHFASDTDATVKDEGDVTAVNNTITVTLTGASPVVITRVAGQTGTDKKPATNTATK